MKPDRIVTALVTALVAVVATLVLGAHPAEAARSINPPHTLQCERYNNKLSVAPTRLWASRGTELALWVAVIQRWNGSRWYAYSRYNFTAMFNYYGQNVSSWQTGWYANNTMNIPVYHRGYYRMAYAVNGGQGGVTATGFVDGARFCYVY